MSDGTVLEGDAGTTLFALSVTLGAASGKAVTVTYGSSNLSAVAPGDYAAAAGQLTFDPGTVSRTIPLTIVGDLVREIDEQLTVTLSAPVNATLPHLRWRRQSSKWPAKHTAS
ncbi:MAG: hypothetical protein H0W08_20735 [Acidobacteria bacterium]|nr:hypothetical protein [Acidobacteriota bacterium]